MKNFFLETKLSGQYKNIPESFVRNILNVANQKGMISFAGGLPNPDFFPIQALTESASAVMQQHGKSILQYAGSLGYYPLREWIALRYSKKYKMDITPEMVVITNGSQQAIDIISKIMIDKGDGVIVEKPSYLGAIQALSAYQPQFLEVDLETDGPNLTQVEEYFLDKNVKMMYSVPNAQNPSGISYSIEKRQTLACLLKVYNQFLLEDDPYNEICFKGDFPEPIKKLAPDNVAWTGSFSKMVAPGLRNGWIILPPELVPHFDKAKQSTDLNPNNLTQYVLHHFLTNNNLDEHLVQIRQQYASQCDYMSQMILRYLPAEVKSTNPAGGMFIWLTLPKGISSEYLIKKVINRGVIFVPGKSFYVNGDGSQNIRMNFTNASFQNIKKGVQIIGEEIKKIGVRNAVVV